MHLWECTTMSIEFLLKETDANYLGAIYMYYQHCTYVLCILHLTHKTTYICMKYWCGCGSSYHCCVKKSANAHTHSQVGGRRRLTHTHHIQAKKRRRRDTTLSTKIILDKKIPPDPKAATPLPLRSAISSIPNHTSTYGLIFSRRPSLVVSSSLAECEKVTDKKILTPAFNHNQWVIYHQIIIRRVLK